MKNKLQEVLENKLQEVSKTNCNNTEYNYTEFNENESYQYLSEQEKGKDRIQERNEYRQLIHDNIEYVILWSELRHGTSRRAGRADAGCNMFDKAISADQRGSCAYTSGQEPFAESRV